MHMTRTPASRRSGHETLRELLRSRSVRLLLASVALVQGVAVAERVTDGSQKESVAGAVPLLSPVVVNTPPEGVLRGAKQTAGEKKALALAEKYERKGYKVSEELAEAIHDAAVENGIDLETAFGLVRAESSFRNSSTSQVGAVGLTQLMPATARWMEPGVTRRELRNPETNLRVGFKYLKYLIKKYDGNERLALLAYNRGPGTVDKALRRGRNPDNGYADFVYGKEKHGHKLFTR